MLILRQPAYHGCAVCLPVGAILERTADSLLIMWREGGLLAPAYQRAAYILDSGGLKIAWGSFAATAAAAIPPALAADTPCDGVTVVCYDHTYHWGY
jgi:hypothetical protein